MKSFKKKKKDLTKIYLSGSRVVDHFDELYDVGMDTLLHDGNFTPDFLLVRDLGASETPPGGFIHNFDSLR